MQNAEARGTHVPELVVTLDGLMAVAGFLFVDHANGELGVTIGGYAFILIAVFQLISVILTSRERGE